ncbi:MAG: F0F1 ATP synthase subunit alpha [Candidatus Omnitrophica bacterium]|nr:F0F1 ATP synthase subunit alpha [Candidatus Omnitrophota bacterium]
MDIKIPTLDIKEVGSVKEVKHGIVKADGLPSCVYGQLVEFSGGIKGMVIGFTPSEVLIIVLGDDRNISVQDKVTSQTELLTVPVGDNFIGRIVDSLGKPLDGKGDIPSADYYPVFRQAAGVMEREPISEPFLTGTKILDLAVPIGKGQRELIVGDRQTGKTSIALDAVINQKGKNVICIYCWTGGSYTTFKKIMHTLAEKRTLGYTLAVCATAASPTAEQYLSVYTAATLGEYFMYKGKDVFVIFDDLTKHAWAYRQISLLLERSPGREAYPGDIFYIHSQLVERAGRLHPDFGGGTMTFFPIVETLQGDITGYIQSNLVSMTDGQVYLNTGLFHEGFKPAIDLGLSVSRIGSKVQCPAIRELGGGLRLEYAQYREMLRMTKLRTRLSDEAMQQMKRGEVLHELLMQENYNPVSLVEEIVLFYAFQKRILEVLDPGQLTRFKNEFFGFLYAKNPSFVQKIEETQELTQDIKGLLDKEFIEYFKKLKEEKT